jgi:uncharacterized delta-60 repeat protein
MANPAVIPSENLDPTLSGNGIVTTSVSAGNDRAEGVLIQADGKIIVAGTARDNTASADFAVLRYNADGSLDTGFSGDGIATASPGSGSDTATSVAIASNGRILVAGYSNSGATDDDFALSRFNADGSLDTSFGNGGSVVTAISAGNVEEQAHAVAVQADGKIVVAGHVSGNNLFDFAVVRYNTDGTLDTGFDGDGIAITSIENSSDYARSVFIQSDGRILVAGFGYNFDGSGFSSNLVLARYNSNGTLDTSFDGDGKLSINPGADESVNAMALDAQGRILLVGETQPLAGGKTDIALWRLTSAGALDTSFGGGDGVVTQDFGNGDDFAQSVVVQADGRIVVGGYNSAGFGQSVLLRYDANGVLDGSFDGDGILARYYNNGTSTIEALAASARGEIVAVGSSYNGSNTDFAALRLGALTGTATATAGSAFSYTVPAGTFVDADSDPLTLSATLAGGGALPAWLSFNAASRTFSGTPTPGDFGTLILNVAASDATASASTTLMIQISSNMIQALMAGADSRWNAESINGTAASLTYSFMTQAPSYANSNESGTFQAFIPAQQAVATQVLAAYADIANLTFTQVSDDGNGGQMRFGRNSQPGDTTGYAGFPGTTPSAGDVWIDKTEPVNDAPVIGDYGYEVMMHEIGHAIGLKHPFEGAPTLPGIEDTRLNTVMSYTDAPNRFFRVVTPTGSGFEWVYNVIHPETPMVYDIAAIQYLYGANMSFHAGDDTYSFDPADPFFKTLWDGGGTDTISVANFANGSIVDLRDGHYSSIRVTVAPLPPGASDSQTNVYDGSNNLGIAFDAIIENATGGAGNDTLIGNAVANRLEGGGGNDTLTGGAGNDIFVFGSTGNGLDTITDFVAGDRVRVTGSALSGVIAAGNGSGLAQNAVQMQSSGGAITIFIGTDATPGADLQFAITGAFQPGALRVLGSDIVSNNAPTAGSFANTSASLGQALTLSPGQLFADADAGDLLNFTASGLPAGLSLNSATGQITGTAPASAGTHPITVTGTDSGGLTASLSFELNVSNSGAILANVVTRGGQVLPGVTLNEPVSNHFTFSRGIADLQSGGAPKPVTAADALDALKLSVGLTASKGNSWKELIAADITGNGTVTAADALEILKTSVGINTIQPSWVFVPSDPAFNPNLGTMTRTNVTYSNELNLSNASASSNAVTGILVGDVNNSWVIPA